MISLKEVINNLAESMIPLLPFILSFFFTFSLASNIVKFLNFLVRFGVYPVKKNKNEKINRY